jgi:ribosome maturation factor RimP
MPGQEEALAERLRSLTDSVLSRHGAELVDLVVRRGRQWLVRLVVDAEGGVDLETCAKVSEEMSRLLDADDPIPGRYTLEVTSPGATRPLHRPEEFRKNLGRKVRVVLAESQHEGILAGVEEGRVRLSTAKGEERIAIEDIVVAKVILPW